MRIRGAVLEEIGRARPYAQSRPLSISDLELDDPGPDEVLVRIEAAGICHSDLSVVDGNRVRPVPMLLGHEAAGRIVRVGSAVQEFSPGQRVVMAFLPRCGECDNCVSGAAPRRVDDAQAPYPVQARVRHAEFGAGMVTDVEDDRLTVLFDDVGYRTLAADLVADGGLLERTDR